MKYFYKIIAIGLLCSVSVSSFSQGTNWRINGNINTNPTNNFLGTVNNFGLSIRTNNIQRQKLNGSLSYAVNGYNGNRDGFMLLGFSQTYATNLFNNLGAFSLLHLNGNEGAFVQDAGYRPWMRTGVTFTDNNDLSYLGIRKVGNGTDITETVLSWSDNSGNGFPGPDDMVFRFTAGGNGNNTISNNLNDVTDLDGLHVARFTGNGEFGIGNTFGAGNPLYVRPTSLQHLSLSDMRSVYTQYTNRNTAVGSGTAETASDGLRFGINGDNNANVNGNALMYNQENRHLLFSTNNNTNFVNIGSGITLERMRITAIAAPTSLAGGGYGVNNPAGLNGNLTRVAISHNPQSPVTRPLSLLHLGYNTGANSLTPTATDGWRNWMDIGMFVSNGTDNTYIGLKQETGIGGDRQDAVLNWGDNDASNPLFGPDNLRFIFTSTTTGSGNSPANSNNGLETARISPAAASTMGTNYGMMGIGDFSPTGPNTAAADVVDAKLDIDGDLRIRTVTEDTTLLQVLVIDSTDHNRVHWRNVDDFGSDDQNLTLTGTTLSIEDGNSVDLSSLDTDTDQQTLSISGNTLSISNGNSVIIPSTGGGTVTADNGLHVFGSNNVRLGGTLVENTTIDLSGKLLSFEGIGYVGIGAPYYSSMLNIKNTGNWLNVLRIANSLNNELLTFSDGKRLAIHAVNDPAVSIAQAVSVNCILDAPASASTLFGVDIFTQANTTLDAVSGSRIGTRIIMEGKTDDSTKTIIGLWAAARSQNNDGVSDYIGVYGFADRGTSQDNIGVWGSASNANTPTSRNIGVKGTGLGAGNFGGYFEGAVHVTGAITAVGTITPSDQQFKTNINPINNASTIINQLQPKVYNLDSANFTQFGFDNKQHMGLIAQEVELILPNLVSNNVILAQTDSLGNEITPQVNYKGLNYQELIPLMIAGMKEQQQTIDHLLEEMDDLKDCLRDANICYGEGNRTMNTEPDNNINNRSVELVNTNSIILDQNLPNPFAENTVINYNIPTEVAEAKLLFYDLNGRIIKELIIDERGESKLTVYGTNLKTGIYTYSLIADGELIATKKMVKK